MSSEVKLLDDLPKILGRIVRLTGDLEITAGMY